MEQDKPISMRPKALRACEVCRIARKRCNYDKNYPTRACALCAKRGVDCSLATSVVDPQPASADLILPCWLDEYINDNQDLSEDDPEHAGGSIYGGGGGA